jgi:adenylosuccinate lyase
MPHKRNPISAETLSGLSRVVRGNLQVGLQNVPLWHERDISHSSAERVVFPDSSLLTHYMVKRLTSLVNGLEVDSERMMANINMLHGVVFSQSVLLALVNTGMSRDDAYRIVQDASAAALQSGTALRAVLEQTPGLPLSGAQLDEIFDLSRVLRHAGEVVDSL